MVAACIAVDMPDIAVMRGNYYARCCSLCCSCECGRNWCFVALVVAVAAEVAIVDGVVGEDVCLGRSLSDAAMPRAMHELAQAKNDMTTRYIGQCVSRMLGVVKRPVTQPPRR